MTSRLGWRAVAGAAIVAATLSACSGDPEPAMGGGSGTDVAATEAPATDATARADGSESPNAQPETSDEGDPSSGSEADAEREIVGEITVGITPYQLHEVWRCIPSEVEGLDRVLELQARGVVPAGTGYDGEDWVQVDVHVQEVAGAPYNEVSWAGPEGVFGSSVQPAEVVYVEGATTLVARGTLADALTQEDTVSVSLTVEVPEEAIDCRA